MARGARLSAPYSLFFSLLALLTLTSRYLSVAALYLLVHSSEAVAPSLFSPVSGVAERHYLDLGKMLFRCFARNIVLAHLAASGHGAWDCRARWGTRRTSAYIAASPFSRFGAALSCFSSL